MGREARDNSVDIARKQAKYEREIGGLYDNSWFADGCPKCGVQQRQKIHCMGKDPLDTDPRQCPIEGEHLHVKCAGCGNSWLERCLDDEDNRLAGDTNKLTAANAVVCALIESLEGELVVDVERMKHYAVNPVPVLLEEIQSGGRAAASLKLAPKPKSALEL